jgi:hypothetical protein
MGGRRLVRRKEAREARWKTYADDGHIHDARTEICSSVAGCKCDIKLHQLLLARPRRCRLAAPSLTSGNQEQDIGDKVDEEDDDEEHP